MVNGEAQHQVTGAGIGIGLEPGRRTRAGAGVAHLQFARLRGAVMDWARILAYVTGTVDQELLARNEYLSAGPAQNVIGPGRCRRRTVT